MNCVKAIVDELRTHAMLYNFVNFNNYFLISVKTYLFSLVVGLYPLCMVIKLLLREVNVPERFEIPSAMLIESADLPTKYSAPVKIQMLLMRTPPAKWKVVPQLLKEACDGI